MNDKTLRLKSGHTLAYTEQGDLSGQPIFFIHGNPGSRLPFNPDETIAQRLGARLITPDRPGYGLSDFQPRRKLLDFPADIAQLADSLGLESFSLFGFSAGGPYVAACAYLIPNRIRRAAIVSGVSPIDSEGFYDGMHQAWRIAFLLSKYLPFWMLRALIWIQTAKVKKNPEQAVTDFGSTLNESDRLILSRPEIKDAFIKNRIEATRKGAKGWAKEAKILSSPWGFHLEAITLPIDLWYWENDTVVTLQMAHYLASTIPDTHLHIHPDGGHLSIIDAWEAILKQVLEL
jgi:pimeloyl-ACP methyl ester carboxylesterase